MDFSLIIDLNNLRFVMIYSIRLKENLGSSTCKYLVSFDQGAFGVSENIHVFGVEVRAVYGVSRTKQMGSLA